MTSPPLCPDLLFISTPDASRARLALAALNKALAVAGCDGIYTSFMLTGDGTSSVWVRRRDGGPVPGSDAWEASAGDRYWCADSPHAG